MKRPPRRSRGWASSFSFTSASPCLRVVLCPCPGDRWHSWVWGRPRDAQCQRERQSPALQRLGPGGSQLLCACVQAEGGAWPYGGVPPSAWLPCRHEYISFFCFFFFLDLFKHQIQNRFVFPGARDLLPLIWCGFFGGGRTGRDLLTGLGEGTGRKKEFQRDKTRGNQKWVWDLANTAQVSLSWHVKYCTSYKSQSMEGDNCLERTSYFRIPQSEIQAQN